MAFGALVPFFLTIAQNGGKAAFCLGYLFGLAHNLSLLYWIYYVSTTFGGLNGPLGFLVLFLLVFYLNLFPALFGLLGVWLGRHFKYTMAVYPALWVVLEWIKAHLFTGFPWELVGYSQYQYPVLIQTADFGGVYVVSFLVVLVNAGIFDLTGAGGRTRRVLTNPGFWIPCISVGLVCGYGLMRLNQVAAVEALAPRVGISVVQGNIDQAVKWSPEFKIGTLNTYARLTAEAAKQSPELIIWPETSLPFFFGEESALSDRVAELAGKVKSFLLFGSPARKGWGKAVQLYNRAYLMSPQGLVLDLYDKQHLVPFGEYLPLKSLLSRLVGGMVQAVGDFAAGAAGHTLNAGFGSIGVLICYESIFPYISRQEVQNGARVLVNITNDAWFGDTGAPYQHLSMLTFRAVENRVWIPRAANTGISGFISSAGLIIGRTELNREAIRSYRVPLADTKSFYSRHGDVFAYLCMFFLIAPSLIWMISRPAVKQE
ncbi:MAG: apolipoprotein N-acyltransferase [Deltaproteobacteria bacterium]|nr:apolipoprotein N-acyltransferase [Deltaproteobacteria bacterium]